MNALELILVSVSLSMDAFAVSITEGIRMRAFNIRYAAKVSFLFGLFQALMPAIGFFAGSAFYKYIVHIDHWVAMGLLCFLGIRMILEARKVAAEGECSDNSDDKTLLMLAIATSIDALAVGITFTIVKANIYVAAPVIGLITFCVCYFGVALGKKLGPIFQKWAETAGGAALIAIGIKILLEHLMA